MTLILRAGLFCLACLALAWDISSLNSPVRAEDTPTYQLRYTFTPGQEWHYVSQTDSEYIISFAQVTDTVLHTSMFLRHITDLGVSPDGTGEIQLMLDRARMTAKNAGVNSLYDSTDPGHVPTEFAGVHQSIGKPLKARLSPQGQVLPSADKTANVEQVELLFQLPEKPIAVGATWKERFEVSVPLNDEGKLFRPVKMERRFELKGVENGIATISLVTVCISPMNDAFQESQLLQRKPFGNLKFDINRGCLIERILKIDDKVVGAQGPGSALEVKIVKVDRLIPADQVPAVDLTKPLIPVRVAAAPATEKK
jgi:hypothetical protein